MTNGGTGPFFGQLVLVNSGRGPLPPSLALVNPKPPHNTTILLDNFFGRQFNSLNDVKIYPGTNKLFFTDVTYVPTSSFSMRYENRTTTKPSDTASSITSAQPPCYPTRCTASTPTRVTYAL